MRQVRVTDGPETLPLIAGRHPVAPHEGQATQISPSARAADECPQARVVNSAHTRLPTPTASEPQR
jgi:hypothetical protein